MEQTTGLVIGKFYPFHHGHKFLIEYASEYVDQVTVIVCYKQTDTIPALYRVNWIKETHPSAIVLSVSCDHLVDDDSGAWADTVRNMIGVPDFVFTSEDYGDPFCVFLGSTHILVDKQRLHVPISATLIRSNPLAHFERLDPGARAYFAKRIAFVGAESTGTTTLAKTVAAKYHTPWVPEYGRLYAEGLVTKELSWFDDDFVHIAQTQNAIEDHMARQATGYLFIDTTSFATSVFQLKYLGHVTQEVLDISKDRKYDMYFVTYPDIPFEQDGTRDAVDDRMTMHQMFIDALERSGQRYIVVRGTLQQRIDVVSAYVDKGYYSNV